ncbi:MAG: zinc-ribbon domain-containing protein [Candidatus Bathyarchaeota archaeon]|nr:zinc-ribbon domain-containing protein [Candidatus Bathyarchaeota archaeon]
MTSVRQIFVSHSKHDKDIVASFDKVFARTGVKSACMEFEDVSAPEWFKIKNTINESKAVFVLLGPNVRSSIYTQNWIAFEVGLACALGKGVWVFEQLNSKIVDFPIPYVTNYMVYNLEEQGHFEYVREIIEGLRDKAQVVWSAVDEVHHEVPKGTKVQCPHCHSKFSLHPRRLVFLKSLNCPSCRQSFTPKKLF